MATIEIDGRRIAAEVGEMLIAAADRAGVYIPRFCYHEKLSVAANCRMCLVEVGHAPQPLPELPAPATPGESPADESTAEAEQATPPPIPREKLRLAPKPLPACATPVTDNMVVFTRSQLAREAQQGTLEFLLINHPLDCPVCDQGGECPLQDQALGYGNDDSRFLENKRAVASPDLGPLVATEMTRCIHCTRCVRFGEEVAGVMELGFPGRGEAAHIATFLGRSVDSEVSGNIIDLCPVGALTSKPYRFAARAWELENHHGISPHDCVGANLTVQTLRGRVERVLPRDNPQVNECWLADRDRYSYEAVNSDRRLRAPLLKQDGRWREVSWEAALQFTCDGIKAAVGGGGGGGGAGGDGFGALAGYTSTIEEYFLLQKLARALGGNHIDHRLQQCDFSDDAAAPAFPASELRIAGFSHVQAALLIGSNLRKEQPLLALRLRAASRRSGGNGARIGVINPLDYAQNFATEALPPAGAGLASAVAAFAVQVAKAGGAAMPGEIKHWADLAADANPAAAQRMAADLIKAREAGDGDGGDGAGGDGGGVVILGALAQQHRQAAAIKAIAQWIAEAAGAKLAVLPPGNSAAAWWAGCVPHRAPGGAAAGGRPGLNAADMLAAPRRAYLLLDADPVLDGIDGAAGSRALQRADFVARITAYRGGPADDAADVLLPMAAFTETAGVYLNCEGRAQRAAAAARPLGEARPAWKILRVLGNFLDLPGFDYVSLDEVNDDIPHFEGTPSARIDSRKIPPRPEAAGVATADTVDGDGTGDGTVAGTGDGAGDAGAGNGAAAVIRAQRLLDMPMYRGDATVRNADALQLTADNPPPAARMNAATVARLGLDDGDRVTVANGDGEIQLQMRVDAQLPDGCVYVPAGHAQTAPLGGTGLVTVTAVEAKAATVKRAPDAAAESAESAQTATPATTPAAAKRPPLAAVESPATPSPTQPPAGPAP
ncbi:MAG: NADH-quinone oxidoreductase subunit NuoG [Gammaproteobacteria bacterium]|nr:NADH-quinone oxidoreductase subunit NuoG [Gammaproteobacteria bacterium]